MIRLAIAEDHNSLIDGIKLFLKYEENMEIVGYANNGQELFDLVKLKRPNMVITDIRMPIMDGITLTKEILAFDRHIKVIAFTMFDQEEAVSQMIAAGAKGYILKNSSLDQLLLAIKTVYDGETYYDPDLVLPDKNSGKKGKGSFN